MYDYEKELQKINKKIFLILFVIFFATIILYFFVLPEYSEFIAISSCKSVFSRYNVENMTLDEMCHMYYCKSYECCLDNLNIESRIRFCRFNVASRINNISICDEVDPFGGNRNQCIINFAFDTKNPEVCFNIEDEWWKEFCINQTKK